MEPHTITFALKPANPEHYADGNGGIKMGMLFFLKSSITGKFDNKPYYTGPHTSLAEFRRWFREKMVYEPELLDGPWEVKTITNDEL